MLGSTSPRSRIVPSHGAHDTWRQDSSYRTLQYQSVPVSVNPDRWLALRLSWTPSSVQLDCLGRRLRVEGVATVGWFGLYAGYASVEPAPIPFRAFLPPQ